MAPDSNKQPGEFFNIELDGAGWVMAPRRHDD